MKKNKLYACLLTATLCLSLCACGSTTGETKSKEESQVKTEQETIQETTPEITSIDFTIENKNIKYVGVERANDGLVDVENVILVIFDFTNNDKVPEMCQQTFWIQYFQNGTECNTSLTRSSDGGEQYKMADKFFDEAMQGGTVRFAQLVQVEDNSPLTIMVSRNGGDEYQMMELDIEAALNGGTTETDSVDVEVVSEEPSVENSSFTTINLGDKIEAKEFDFTLNNVELTYEVKPYNTSSFYTSYTAEDGKVFVHIDGEYYNKSKKDVCIRDLFIPNADYDNGYVYEGFAIVNEGDNSFDWVSSYVACTPLNTCHYHGLIECPEVIDGSEAPLFVTFEIDGTTYRYDIR